LSIYIAFNNISKELAIFRIAPIGQIVTIFLGLNPIILRNDVAGIDRPSRQEIPKQEAMDSMVVVGPDRDAGQRGA